MTALSYAKGPTQQQLLDITIPAAMDAAVAKWGDKLALSSLHQNIRWTWAELAA